jgi:hypothetical protein
VLDTRILHPLAILDAAEERARASIGTGDLPGEVTLHNSHVISRQIHTQSLTIGADRTNGGSRPWADTPPGRIVPLP